MPLRNIIYAHKNITLQRRQDHEKVFLLGTAIFLLIACQGSFQLGSPVATPAFPPNPGSLDRLLQLYSSFPLLFCQPPRSLWISKG